MNTKVSRKPRNTKHFNLIVFLGFRLTFVFTYIIFSKLVIANLYFVIAYIYIYKRWKRLNFRVHREKEKLK